MLCVKKKRGGRGLIIPKYTANTEVHNLRKYLCNILCGEKGNSSPEKKEIQLER